MAETIGEISKLVLGGERRLEIAAAIAACPEGLVTTGAIVKATGFGSTEVSKEIGHFRQAGLLQRVAHGQYQRKHEEFWSGCRSVLDRLVAEGHQRG